MEQADEASWRELITATDRYLKGRSFEDVEYFCVHGYLPEVPIPGQVFAPKRLPWKEEWEKLKLDQKLFATHTVQEREFFCANGYWPAEAKEKKRGDS